VYVRAPASEVDRSLDALRRLHGEVFGPSSLFLPRFDLFAHVARCGVASGELSLHELRAGDETVAIDVVLEVAGRISTYQGGRLTDPRWNGAGLVLQAALIDDACRRGVREFDHLRGVTDYKLSWAPRVRPIGRLVTTSGLRGHALGAVWSAVPRLVALRARVRRSVARAAQST
jgi:CelD/BcsL family acetyltransferase involved in cellulose biosynthesis